MIVTMKLSAAKTRKFDISKMQNQLGSNEHSSITKTNKKMKLLITSTVDHHA
jgi:hypothetical protein